MITLDRSPQGRTQERNLTFDARYLNVIIKSPEPSTSYAPAGNRHQHVRIPRMCVSSLELMGPRPLVEVVTKRANTTQFVSLRVATRSRSVLPGVQSPVPPTRSAPVGRRHQQAWSPCMCGTPVGFGGCEPGCYGVKHTTEQKNRLAQFRRDNMQN